MLYFWKVTYMYSYVLLVLQNYMHCVVCRFLFFLRFLYGGLAMSMDLKRIRVCVCVFFCGFFVFLKKNCWCWLIWLDLMFVFKFISNFYYFVCRCCVFNICNWSSTKCICMHVYCVCVCVYTCIYSVCMYVYVNTYMCMHMHVQNMKFQQHLFTIYHNYFTLFLAT